MGWQKGKRNRDNQREAVEQFDQRAENVPFRKVIRDQVFNLVTVAFFNESTVETVGWKDRENHCKHDFRITLLILADRLHRNNDSNAFVDEDWITHHNEPRVSVHCRCVVSPAIIIDILNGEYDDRGNSCKDNTIGQQMELREFRLIFHPGENAQEGEVKNADTQLRNFEIKEFSKWIVSLVNHEEKHANGESTLCEDQK